MQTIKGPAIFLAQFAGDAAPFNSLGAIARWAAGHGYKGVQIPSWDARLFDLKRAAESKTYCDEVAGICAESSSRRKKLSISAVGIFRRRASSWVSVVTCLGGFGARAMAMTFPATHDGH